MCIYFDSIEFSRRMFQIKNHFIVRIFQRFQGVLNVLQISSCFYSSLWTDFLQKNSTERIKYGTPTLTRSKIIQQKPR